jgi:hypothetical protein
MSPAAVKSISVGMGRWPGFPSAARSSAGLRLRPGIVGTQLLFVIQAITSA